MKQIVLVVMLAVIGMTSASMLWEKDTMDVLKTIARKLDGGFPGDEEKFPKAISKKIDENSVEKPKKPQVSQSNHKFPYLFNPFFNICGIGFGTFALLF